MSVKAKAYGIHIIFRLIKPSCDPCVLYENLPFLWFSTECVHLIFHQIIDFPIIDIKLTSVIISYNDVVSP